MLHILYDGNNTAFRADMTRELYTTKGVRTSAINGVLEMIHKTAEDLKDKLQQPIGKVIITWDAGHSAMRKSIFPEYKINRKLSETEDSRLQKEAIIEQTNALQDGLPFFGFYSVKVLGWEGDDLAYLCCKLLRKLYPNDFIIVVTTDEDYHQFLQFENLGVYNPTKQILFAQRNYRELTGIDFTQFLEYKIMKGDSSDGINGISGIGEKTAKDLLNKYHSLEVIYSSPSVRQELMKSKRTAKLYDPDSIQILARNRKLIDISSVDFSEIEKPIENFLKQPVPINEKEIFNFLQKYELHTILSKVSTWLSLFRSP